MFRNLLYTLVAVVTISTISFGQDPVFSQFFSTPIQLNPALTGATIAPRITLNYRNQWPSLNNAFVTYAASYDQYFPDYNSGFGVLIMSDVAGDGLYKTNTLDFSYSYNFTFDNDWFLKGGLEAGFVQSNVDWNRLVFLDQIDPLTGATDPTGAPNPTNEPTPFNTGRLYLDVGTGLVLYNKNFYAGASLKHINAPDESILRNFGTAPVPIRVTIHAGGNINLQQRHKKYIEGTFISPNVMYVRQGQFSQINAGAYAQMSKVFGGLWYRYSNSNQDAAILLMGYRYQIFKIGYSYDVTLSNLSGRSGGAHEISVVINFDNDPKTRKRQRARRQLDCFKMFK